MLFLLLLFVQLINGLKIRNEFIEEPKDVQGVIGSTVLLRCRTESLDESQVTWCKNDFCTLGKSRDLPFYPRYEIIGNAHQGEHHFQISNLSLEDIGMYQCQIRAGRQRPPSMSRKAKLTVLQIPESLSIDSPVLLVENVLSYVICRASNAMPEAKLSWHFPESMKYVSKNDYALLSDQSLRNSISNVTLIAQRSFHGQLIQCQAHSTAIETLNRTMITQEYIQTIFPPEINLRIIGEEIENEMITIVCQIFCRPDLKKIEWFNGTNLLNVTNKSRLSIVLNRAMHNNRISCQARNQVGIRNQSINLQIIYQPKFVDINGNELSNYSVLLVNEGQSIELECFVHSYPSALIFWTFEEKILSRNETILHIEKIQSNADIGLYQCHAQHSFFGIFNRTIRLALKTPPEMLTEKRIYFTYLEEIITLTCSFSKDIPIEEMFWSREDQTKINSDQKYQMIENRSDHLIEYHLSIGNILISDQGFYICTGINQFGLSKSQFEIIVQDRKIDLIRRLLFYGSIAFGICLSFILISVAFIHHFRQYSKRRIKSSTTDRTISSLSKEQENVQLDEQDETISTVEQCLLEEQLNNNQINDFFESPEEHFFYSKHYPKGHSTVV